MGICGPFSWALVYYLTCTGPAETASAMAMEGARVGHACGVTAGILYSYVLLPGEARGGEGSTHGATLGGGRDPECSRVSRVRGPRADPWRLATGNVNASILFALPLLPAAN